MRVTIKGKKEKKGERRIESEKGQYMKKLLLQQSLSSSRSVDPRKLHALKWPSLSSFHSSKFYQFSSVAQIHYSRFFAFWVAILCFFFSLNLFSHQCHKRKMLLCERFRPTYTESGLEFLCCSHRWLQTRNIRLPITSVLKLCSPLHMVNRALMWNSQLMCYAVKPYLLLFFAHLTSP